MTASARAGADHQGGRGWPDGADPRTGQVVHVNVSAGGVPKLPVAAARVGRDGLDGDAHDHDAGHGGPHRAVCLLAIEAIERVRADGHDGVAPGAVGWPRLAGPASSGP